MNNKYMRNLRPILDSANEFMHASANNVFVASGILLLPLVLLISNYIVIDQLPIDLPTIGFTNNSTSLEGGRLGEVITALSISDGEDYINGESGYLFKINEDIREAGYRSAISSGDIDFAVIIPPNFGSDNQNGRVQGELIIIGDRDTNPSVRVMENVINETLKEYNDEQNEKAIGRAPIDIYSYRFDVTPIDRPIYQPKLSNYAILMALPAFMFILRQIRKYRNNNSSVKSRNEGLPDIIFVAIFLWVVQVILWISTLAIYRTVSVDWSLTLRQISVAIVFSWFLGLYLGGPDANKAFSRLPKFKGL